MEQLEVGAARLEDAELREGPADVQPDEVEGLLPAVALDLAGAVQLVPRPPDEDLVERSREVERVGQRQPPDSASDWRWEASPPGPPKGKV